MLKPSLRASARSKIAAWALSSVLALTCLMPAHAMANDDDIMIPNLGTSGSLGLTVQKEEAIGKYFQRAMRSNLAVVDDPVLSEYVNSLGNKLLLHADNVNFPFGFYVVYNRTLNASAFLGGQVIIHTGLFSYARTEDEFASVIAHEISHVTQRHIARFMEKMAIASQLSLAGIIGGVAMSIINPALGMAALTSSMGAGIQSRINFTRDNEYEADRIGIALLYRAGLNPKGMVDMFRKLSAEQGNLNPAFTLLLDHPLSDIRVAEAQNRLLQYQKRNYSSNPNYDFARARVAVRYNNVKSQQEFQNLKQTLLINADKENNNYRNYALALTCLELKQFDEARKYLGQLSANLNSNFFVIDAKTDIDLASKNYSSAISRLDGLYKRLPNNQVIVANLANALIENGNSKRAVTILEKYLRYNEDDVLALSLLEKAYQKTDNKCASLQTRGEIYALSAVYSQSIKMYNEALRTCSDYYTRERIKARVSQIAVQRSFDEQLGIR